MFIKLRQGKEIHKRKQEGMKEKDLPSDMPSAWFLMYRVKHGGHETTLLVFPIFRLTFGNLVKL